MLYITSRNHNDTYTAQRAVMPGRAPDGGLFLPFRIIPFSEQELRELADMPFNHSMAGILNRLFQTRFTGWDLDFGIGRNPVRMEAVTQRILVAECWHNPGREFTHMAKELAGLIRKDSETADCGFWLETGIRISVLFGVFSDLLRQKIVSEEKKMDICVNAGNFSAPLSAWYARAMGLPIGNIVICCNENNAVWNLIHGGQMRTDLLTVSTDTPELDIVLPEGLEALISVCCGTRAVDDYLQALRRGRMYCPETQEQEKLGTGISVSVVSTQRVRETIPNVYGTSSYLMSPYTALSYGGLMDYRAKSGSGGYALILAEKSPENDQDIVASALGIPSEELIQLLKEK